MVVIGGGIVTYLVMHELVGLAPAQISALGGCFIAAGLSYGMLFEGWLSDPAPRVERATLLLATVVLAALLTVVLRASADALHLNGASADEWVTHASLNALSTSIILHVAIGRRWPFPHPAEEVPDA
ncbi:hypothetical protein E0H75_21825 [Kribbella capetownensis]|uniref:Uncharacterized protein n=1 Tax=Kribbella capetownensis TaxID=1572659 RepID=A0A4R0JM43_9ACTN|nr:hypothetical protein [Kribbella capetownensis]TCC47427.1 hypothetical protein E0H75_21825 [Kribbella capetownensis]